MQLGARIQIFFVKKGEEFEGKMFIHVNLSTYTNTHIHQCLYTSSRTNTVNVFFCYAIKRHSTDRRQKTLQIPLHDPKPKLRLTWITLAPIQMS